MEFFDIHCHSEYSPLDGLDKPETLVLRGKEIGLSGLAITDHGTLASHRDMLKAGIRHDFKIALGCEVYLSTTNDRFDKRSNVVRKKAGELSIYHHLILVAKNDRGLRNLQIIMSKAWNESYVEKWPIVDFELIAEYGDDLIISSACVSGPIAQHLALGNVEKADEWAKLFVERFGDDFYIENQVHNNSIHEGLTEKLLGFADDRNIKSIITTDTHFAREEDKWIEDALLILNTYNNAKKNSPKTIDREYLNELDFLAKYNYLYPGRPLTFEHIDVFLQTGGDLYAKFMRQGIDRPDLFANTIEILDKIKAA